MRLKKIKIGYFADGPWGHNAFRVLINDPQISIEFIVPRTDTKDGTLKQFAEEYNIDYLHPVKVNSEKFYSKAKSYNCDLFISMSFNQIFRDKIINLPKLKIINCHAGKLPFYRGRNILNWALINDEKDFGITVHFVDQGIDTGDIILQKIFPINDNDNYHTILNLAYEKCPEVLYEAVKSIMNEKYKRIKQSDIHSIGSYCSGRTVGDEVINWNQNSREIFNFVRAICYPGPCARTYIDKKEIVIQKVKLVSNAPQYKGTPGQVLSKTDQGFYVKTLDSFVELTEYKGKIKVGDRLLNGS